MALGRTRQAAGETLTVKSVLPELALLLLAQSPVSPVASLRHCHLSGQQNKATHTLPSLSPSLDVQITTRFELILHVKKLERNKHILHYLDMRFLRLPEPRVKADDVLILAHAPGLQKHNDDDCFYYYKK